MKGFFLQKFNPVIQNRNYISQPTLAEGRCLVLLLASFMQMAAQTGEKIVISKAFISKLARFFHMPVPSPTTAFYHDMLLTKRWAIAVDSSLRRDSSRLLSGRGITFFNSSYSMRSWDSTNTHKRYQLYKVEHMCEV